MKDGLLSVVAAAGGVTVVLLWSMSANDPYWRLFETQSVPAPAYESAEDLRAVLAATPVDAGNTDTGAESPADQPLIAVADSSLGLTETVEPIEIVSPEAEIAAIPEPLIAMVPPLEAGPVTAPAVDLMIAYRMPDSSTYQPTALQPVRTGFNRRYDVEAEADTVLAFAPTQLPVPVAQRDRGEPVVTALLEQTTLDPFVAPPPPVQPQVLASETSEEILALDKAERIDVQRRLALAGFNPNGFDGVFGPQTRAALADFQTAWGFPATGYLEASVYADLTDRTEDAYQALRRQAAAAPSVAPELAPIARERQLASAETEERCARRSDGKIIARQSLSCDLAGFGEQFVSLGRNTLEYETGDGTVAIGVPTLVPGAER